MGRFGEIHINIFDMNLYLLIKETSPFAFVVLSIISCIDSSQSKGSKNEVKDIEVPRKKIEAVSYDTIKSIKEVKKYDSVEETNDWYRGVNNKSKWLKLVKLEGKIGFLKESNEELFPCIFDSVADVNNNEYRRVKGKFEITKRAYFTHSYNDSHYAKVKKEGKWGLISIDGQIAVPIIYDEIFGFDYTKTGRMEGPYMDYWDYTGELAVVKKEGNWGLINTKGEVVASFVYDQFFIPTVHLFSEHRAAAKKDGKWGFLDKNGKQITSFIYDTIGSAYMDTPMNIQTYKEGMAVVEKGGKVGAIDSTGIEKVSFIYDHISNFDKQMAIAQREGKWGYISRDGDPIIPLVYDQMKWFEDGLCPVMKDSLWGFLNEAGEISIPLMYEDIQIINTASIYEGLWFFSQDGYCALKKNGSWGLIDRGNNIVTHFKYDSIKFTSRSLDEWRYFSDGFLSVRIGKFWSVVNKDGVNHIPFEYDDVEIWSEGNVCVKRNGKWGLLDSLGRQLVSIEHEYAMDAGNYLYRMSRE